MFMYLQDINVFDVSVPNPKRSCDAKIVRCSRLFFTCYEILSLEICANLEGRKLNKGFFNATINHPRNMGEANFQAIRSARER